MDEQQLQNIINELAQTQDPNVIAQFLNQLGENAEPFMQMLMQKAQQGDQSAQMAIQNIQQTMQSMQQQTPSMKLGAKINYIKSLRGQCPDGYEMQYFQKGGIMCAECRRKQQRMEEGGKTPMNAVDSFRCGRKIKKNTCGGNLKKKK